MFDDEDGCDGCGRFECECCEDRGVDDFDRCPGCGSFDCWSCGGFAGGGVEWVWYDEPPARGDYARVLRRLAAKRRRADRHYAALARFGHRLRRAILAARHRRLRPPAPPHPASCSCNDCVPF